jgi:hypothetical protein
LTMKFFHFVYIGVKRSTVFELIYSLATPLALGITPHLFQAAYQGVEISNDFQFLLNGLFFLASVMAVFGIFLALTKLYIRGASKV